MKTKTVSLMLIFIILFTNMTLAANVVTKEALETGYKNVFKMLEDDAVKITDIKVNDDNVLLKANGVEYEIKYDLTENPTFTMEIPVSNGMSYEEYKKLENIFDINMYSYLAYANANNVSMENIQGYFVMVVLASLGSIGSIDTSQSVIVVPPGVTYSGPSTNVFYEDTFHNDVIKYVNVMYNSQQSMTDEKLLNSFKYDKKVENIDDNNAKIVTKVEIKKDFDFNQINEVIESEKQEYEKTMQERKAKADHVIQLKVGQKCKFITVDDIRGYSSFGGTTEMSEDNKEVVGESVGDTYLELTIGKDIVKKIYFEVSENPENQTYADIELVLQEKKEEQVTNTTQTPEPTQPAQPSQSAEQQPQQSSGGVTSAVTQGISKLPNAGYHVKPILYTLYVILGLCIIMLCVKIYDINKK